MANKKRPTDSGRTDRLGRTVRVSDQAKSKSATADPPAGMMSGREVAGYAHWLSGKENQAPPTGSKVRIVGELSYQRYAGQVGTVTDHRATGTDAPGARMVLMDDGAELRIFGHRPREFEVVGWEVPAHPEYDYETGWTDPAVRSDIEALPDDGYPALRVRQISEVLDRHGYDSIDRELAFWYWSNRMNIRYDYFNRVWSRMH